MKVCGATKFLETHWRKIMDIRHCSSYVLSTESNAKTKMGAWQIHSYGDVDELQFSDKLKIPQIRSSNECLVKVRSTSVNPIDLAMLGGYGSIAINTLRCAATDIEFPLTLGREFSGILKQKGMGCRSGLNCGDRVWGVVPVHSMGCHAEYVTVPDYCISQSPSKLSHEEAAGVLYGGLTAWSGLYISGYLGGLCGVLTSSGGGSGKRALVLGGSGGVGSTAIQILKSQNVTVVSTCSTDAVSIVTDLGADHVVDYTNADQMSTLRRHSPFDIVLDCAGQSSEYAETLDCTFSQYVTFSSPLLKNIDSSGLAFGLLRNIADLVESNAKSIANKNAFVKWGYFIPAPQGIEFLRVLGEKSKLNPVIDSRFNFDKLPEAFEKAKQGHLRGKIIVNLK